MKNELKHLSQFRAILKSYKMSDSLKDELGKVELVVLTAPTSIGRNTIIRELLKTGDFHFVVSDTTRHPRINDGVLEQNGVEYWFKTENEFLEGLKQGQYLEAAIVHDQQISGVNISEFVAAYQNKRIALTDVEVQGVEALASSKPDLIAIFVVPPSFEEWMRRLKQRGEMSNEEFKRRLVSAVNEFSYALESDKFIFLINDKLIDAVEKIQTIVKSSSADMKEQERCKELVIELREKVKNLLSTLD